MIKSKTFHAWVLAISLLQTFRQSVDASSYCGADYNDAIATCDITCDYNAQPGENGCPEDKPYCFGPDLPCTPPDAGANSNATNAVDTGYLSLGDLSQMLASGDNETNATSVPSVASTGNESLAPSITPAPSPVATNETNNTVPPSFTPTNVTIAPTSAASTETNVTMAPSPAASNDTTATIAPSVANVTVPPSPAPTEDELAFRKSIDNPQNMFCGSDWQNATDECNTNADAIPCPIMVDQAGANTPLECPTGSMCFTIGMTCTPVTPVPTELPTFTPTSGAPTTNAPSSSPIAANDEVNLYFCGSDLAEANELCSQWCRYGEDTECPEGQRCFKDTSCNATALNFTIGWDESLISEVPSIAPTTYRPTEDQNPGDYYCFAAWTDATYDGDCGVPCPGGQNSECPDGQFCYGPIPLCTSIYKAGVTTKWCGSTFEDMASKCATECPNGTDEECPNGEICWGDSPCALKKSAVADLAAMEGKLWCGKNYKDLVENCPKECPGGSDDECGDEMICFDMSTEEMSCNETGVGIKPYVDPLHLWCGSTWNNVLEECPKGCPEGTDEECGTGMICYDLSENDVICRTPGIGVKEKGDPEKRWCGADYNDMMSSCPRRCPGGSNDECPLGMSCFEGSDCVTEGVGLISSEEKDSTKMFCGTDYSEAMSCGTPCSSGSNDECPSGQTCWADVECLDSQNAQSFEASTSSTKSFEASTSSTTVVNADAAVEGEPDQSLVSEEETQTSSSMSPMSSEVVMEKKDEPNDQALVSPTEQNDQEFDYPTEPENSSESESQPQVAEPAPETTKTGSSEWSMFNEVDMPEDEESEGSDYPTESNESDEEPEPQPEPAQPRPESQPQPEPEQPQPESQPQPEPEQSQPEYQPESQPQPASEQPQTESQPQQEPEPSPQTGLQVKNVRMALYGIPQLTSDVVNAWESLTEEYFERFYNEFSDPGDTIRSDVTDVDTIYEVTELSVSSTRRGLRSPRKLSDVDAYLVEYTQTTRFLSGSGVKLEEVLQYPFSTSRKRHAYVQFLKNSNDLFKDLSDVSAVFLPQKVEAIGAASSFPSSSSGSPPATSSSGNPFGEPSFSSSSGASTSAVALGKFSSFYCHNSGEACPSGTCLDNDECVFVPSSDPVPVGSYAAAPVSDSDSGPGNAASSIIGSFLSGESQDPPTTATVGPYSIGSSNNSPGVSSDTSSIDSSNVSTDGTSSDTSVSSGSGSIDLSTDSDSTLISASSDSSSLSASNSNAAHGPITVKGEMTLTGMEMIKVDNIFEWQYLTAVYEQEFYNKENSDGDYVKESINNVATTFEIVEVHYGADSNDPITVIKFKQTIKYDTDDEDIPVSAVVTQPFLTPEYRQDYISYLRKMLPDTFGSLSTSSSIPENVPQTGSGSAPVYKDLSETFFCGESWPVDCTTAQSCVSGDMCPYGQTCFTAPMCVAQKKDSESSTNDSTESTMSEFAESVSSSTTTPVAAFADEETYPENTYFCGTSSEDAARTCGNPCPLRDSNACPDEQQCFGNTHCEERESFFCGTSWLDASDKCSTPCPNGDASVCGEGEACFAWTSCLNTESFYCGVSFEDASENCAYPCESRSSLDCPEGMGCFAYTTCQATKENAEHVVNPSSVPMNGFFCGTTLEDAATKCATGGSIACQSGNDEQCPGEMKCFETAECSDRATYFCGTTWMEAAETCSKPCSSGSSNDCGEGESCFAHTGCQATNLFYCGTNFEDASESCGKACESRSSDECPGEQLCFAYVSACADKESDSDNISLGAFSDFSKFETTDTREKEPEWVASYWAGLESSSPTKSAPIAFALVAFLSLWLCTAL